MSGSPDIKNTSFIKVIFYWLLGTFSLLGLLGFIIWYVDRQPQENDEKNIAQEVFQRGFPSDFFDAGKSEEVKPEILTVEEPEPEPESEPELPPKVMPKVEFIRAESIEEMFGATVVSVNDNTRRIKDFNKSRRISGRTFSQGEKLKKQVIPNNSEKHWKEYGISQDFASYPVDLSRTITVDRNIRCILREEIDSELEGKITCRVEENVYGAHDRFVLIPAGSMAIGYYQPLRKTGDTRILAGWNRIITPQGININLSNDEDTGAQLSDAMGRSGITGDVDNKFMTKYGLAFGVATINAVASANYVADSNNQQIVIENYGREIGQLSNTILQENINIKPKVTIPAGRRVLISPLIDIWFKPPRNKEIELAAIPSADQG